MSIRLSDFDITVHYDSQGEVRIAATVTTQIVGAAAFVTAVDTPATDEQIQQLAAILDEIRAQIVGKQLATLKIDPDVDPRVNDPKAIKAAQDAVAAALVEA